MNDYSVDRRKTTGIDEVNGIVYCFSSIPAVGEGDYTDEGYITDKTFKFYEKPYNADGSLNAYTNKLVHANNIRLYVYFGPEEYYYQGNVKIIGQNDTIVAGEKTIVFTFELI